ncbi:MAG TPA: hypothetical protein VMR98_04635 [Candidatus Polarisedimenticolaceae bacterium]|nr:hypothetical protein [Candidatus Polarisedimenticolaceae bacterium]
MTAIKQIFSWQGVVVALGSTAALSWFANGPVWGTAHLQELIPGVTIPDLTPLYSAHELPGFFQAMGDQGRAAYRTINTFDFLLIISYTLFAVLAIGAMLRSFMGDTPKATKLALLGLLPGIFDAVESSCFRVIVTSPYDKHHLVASVAAFSTKLKFITMILVLLVLWGLLIITTIIKLKRRR